MTLPDETVPDEAIGRKAGRVIVMKEYAETFVDPSGLTKAEEDALFNACRSGITVDEPTRKTGGRWRLLSQGVVGSIPITPTLRLHVEPKTPVENIFRMLEYAYNLKSFRFLDGLIRSDRIDDLYERLAGILARRVIERCRRGLYRAYVGEEEKLSFVRGEMDLPNALRTPWDPRVHCRYDENTSDVVENRILLWTLQTIMRQGICSGKTLDAVRTAWRALSGYAGLQRVSPRDCVGRLYHRLNHDYEPMHALCRFFLEQSGPSHRTGDRTMLPFVVDMARLYEAFVAVWLKKNAPERFKVEAQKNVRLSGDQTMSITIDILIKDRESGETLWVLDTKYKNPRSPSSSDMSQIVSYAASHQCRRGGLIYPQPPENPFNANYGRSEIVVRTLSFRLDDDLDAAGAALLASLNDEL